MKTQNLLLFIFNIIIFVLSTIVVLNIFQIIPIKSKTEYKVGHPIVDYTVKTDSIEGFTTTSDYSIGFSFPAKCAKYDSVFEASTLNRKISNEKPLAEKPYYFRVKDKYAVFEIRICNGCLVLDLQNNELYQAKYSNQSEGISEKESLYSARDKFVKADKRFLQDLLNITTSYNIALKNADTLTNRFLTKYKIIQRLDTIPVIMLVSDTTHHYNEYLETQSCKEVGCSDSVKHNLLTGYIHYKIVKKEYGTIERPTYLKRGYSVREYRGSHYGHGRPHEINYFHLYYLDSNKKPLNKNIFVWQSQSINMQNLSK